MLFLALGLGACATPPGHRAKLATPPAKPEVTNRPVLNAYKKPLSSNPTLSSSRATLPTDKTEGEATSSLSKSQPQWTLMVPDTPPVKVGFNPKTTHPKKPPSILTRGLNTKEINRIKSEAKRVFRKHWPVSSIRSTYYRQRILGVFADMNAPLELQVIPIVESGYNPYAISPTGATGLWQLMPGTARYLGVRHNQFHDGSRHVEESTRAALKYLIKLKNHFHYWPLAIAAYHVGPGHMDRRLRRHHWRPENGLRHLPAPRITRAYVRHVLGLAAMYHDGEWTFPPPMETERLTVNGPVDLNALERSSGLDRTSLFLLNPGLEQNRYLVGKISFCVPTDKLTLIQENLNNSITPATSTNYVTIKKGDTLWSIARQHWAHVADIRRLNPGMGRFLRIGQRLKVANTISRKHSNRALANPLLAKRRVIQYRVRRGDSVWLIANRFRVSPKAIAKANQLGKRKHYIIHPGQKLLVPTSARYARRAPVSSNKRLRYTVRSGDSLWRIARKFGTSVNSIAHANKIAKGHKIRPGDRLWIMAKN